MNVGQVIEQATAWVEAHGQRIAGFGGAHLMGGILSMPHDAEFPAYRDVDLNIIIRNGAPGTETFDLAYNGLILEYTTAPIERYCSPAAVLANPELASNLRAGGILADPLGILGPLQRAVAEDFADPHWVAARMAHEKQVIQHILDGLRRVESPLDAPFPLFSAGLFMAGLLAEASLRPPTHRRCMVVLRDVLHTHGRRDLHEATLEAMGWGHLRRQEAESYLLACTEAFDRAASVTRTPVPFQAKLQQHIRPYVVAGSREMIDQGYHREAMFWISGFIIFANAAIQADGTAEEKPRFQAVLERLVADMGLFAPGALTARVRQVEALVDAISNVADALVEQRAEAPREELVC